MRSSKSTPDEEVKVNDTTDRKESSLPKEDRLDYILEFARSGNEVPESTQRLSQHLPTDAKGMGTAGLHVYEDKQGLPVMYDSVTTKQSKKAKSDEISVLWHELLSPLTVIKGYTSTLLELKHVITEEQREQYLRGIESASNRVIRLLENLRDITRLEETDAVTTQSVSIVDLLRQVISEMYSQTTKHVIKLHPFSRLPRVRVDPEKIEQVISNLLTNAIKYSPQGGDIEVEVKQIQDEQELRRMYGNAPMVRLPCLIVSIADNGIGIPEAELDHIFKRFYRVNRKLTRSIPGAGLGLYICKIIVGAHGGHIWARNRVAQGSIFSFSLPLE